ncbi:MAG: DUF935 family protein [Bacteroidetes bacterium]|nr:DUF935 family protein [Bacteroidota bacterium]
MSRSFLPALRQYFRRSAAPQPPATSAPPSGTQQKLRERLITRTLYRMNEDIGTWRTALRQAENREYPSRRDLARVYQEILLDAHLTALVQNRQQAVLGHAFALCNTTGQPQPEATRLLETVWFDQLVGAVLDVRLEGYVLVELGLDARGRVADAQKIPMQYVEPHSGTLLREGHLGGERIPYRGVEAYAHTLMEVGAADDLGLLFKAAPHVLWKRSASKFWAEYCQLYGMPVAIAKTNAYDSTRKDMLDKLLSDMRAAYHIVMDREEDLQFLETGKSDGSPVYDKLIGRCNSELSKLILGQTMTTDDGSSLAQAQVHQRVADSLVQADLRLVERVVNNQLLPRLQQLGYALDGLHFCYLHNEALSPDLLLQLLQYYEVDADYLSGRFGVPLASSSRGDI